jgi:hypothetical protein
MHFYDFYWMRDSKRGSMCEKKNSATDLVAMPVPLRHIDPDILGFSFCLFWNILRRLLARIGRPRRPKPFVFHDSFNLLMATARLPASVCGEMDDEFPAAW